MGQSKLLTVETRELASGYALGVLSPEELSAFEQLLATDPAAAADVNAFREIAVDLAHSVPLSQPAARVREGLFARIDAAAKASALADLVTIVRVGETGWVPTPFLGVEVKRLFVDPVSGMITTLLRAAAGAIYPAHEHGGFEQVYVVDGDMIFDDHALDTGDYEVQDGQTRHSAIRTTEGCLALIIHSPKDKVFPG